MPRAFLRGFQRPAFDSRGGPFASMRPRREVLLTTFADPSTFPSVFETPTSETETPEASATSEATGESATGEATDQATPTDQAAPTDQATAPELATPTD